MGIRVNPQQHYQSVSDSELQSLAEQYDQLMPDAQQALLAELQRRGSTEGIQTAKSVEAGTNEGLKYLTITDASGRLTGSFRVIAPRISILKFPKFCPCGKPANKELGVGAAHITGSVFPISPVLTRVEAVNYRVPHCSECARGGRRKQVISVVVFIFVLVIGGLFGALVGDLRGALGVMAILLSITLVVLKLRRGRPPLRVPEGIFMLDYDEKSVCFIIQNRSYAETFCEMNREFLIANAS